jgi:hypothetical protein
MTSGFDRLCLSPLAHYGRLHDNVENGVICISAGKNGSPMALANRDVLTVRKDASTCIAFACHHIRKSIAGLALPCHSTPFLPLFCFPFPPLKGSQNNPRCSASFLFATCKASGHFDSSRPNKAACDSK